MENNAVNNNENVQNNVKVASNDVAKTVKNNMYKIDPRLIDVVDGFNSRVDFALDELKESIKLNGIKNPISVIPTKDDNGNERYRLVDGERRYRAVMSLLEDGEDIKRIPAIFLSKSLTPEELLMEQLLRNEGKRFTEYEYAIAFRKFIDLGYQPSEIVKKLGLAPWKTIFLTHLERDERVQKLMREGRIEGTEVRRIYQAHGKEDEKGAVDEIVSAAKRLKESGNTDKKITLASLDKLSSKTVAVKDSAAIKKGLSKLFEYYRKATNDGEIEIELNLTDVFNRLSNGKETIADILGSLVADAQKNDTVTSESEDDGLGTDVSSMYREAE